MEKKPFHGKICSRCQSTRGKFALGVHRFWNRGRSKVPIKEEGTYRIAIGDEERISTELLDSDAKKSNELPSIQMGELAKHNTEEDLWVALHGVVYDLTEFAHEHPAGFKSLFDLAGTDGTAAFDAVHNLGMLDDFEQDKRGVFV